MMNTSKICRLCLDPSHPDDIELFSDNATELNVLWIISQYLWFEPAEENKISNIICTSCWCSLSNFHEFYIKIRAAQDKLISIDATPEETEKYADANNVHGFSDKIKNETDIKQEIEDDASKQHPEISNSDAESVVASSESGDSSYTIKKNKKKKLPKPVPRKRGRPPKGTNTSKSEAKSEESKLKKKIDKAQQEEEDQKIRDFIQLSCKMCLEEFQTFVELKTHFWRAHSMKGYVMCCEKKFFRRGTLLQHIDWHVNPKIFSCSICNKSFANRRGMENHMLNFHGPEDMKQFKCDICGRGFLKKYLLSHHMSIIHIPEEKKIHKCDQCGKGFALPSILHSHIRSIHEFAHVNVCEICAKVFKSKQQWERHKRLEHSEDKPRKVQCTICLRWLKTEVGLYSHTRRFHNNDMPQTCDVCGKVSRNKFALRSHQRYVHEAERQHKCSVCDKGFRKPIELREHMASHTGVMLYVCSYCPITFNSSANMHSHQKKKHTAEWQRDRDIRLGPDHPMN